MNIAFGVHLVPKVLDEQRHLHLWLPWSVFVQGP